MEQSFVGFAVFAIIVKCAVGRDYEMARSVGNLRPAIGVALAETPKLRQR